MAAPSMSRPQAAPVSQKAKTDRKPRAKRDPNETPVQAALRLANARRPKVRKALAALGKLGVRPLSMGARERICAEVTDWAGQCVQSLMRQSKGDEQLELIRE